MSGMGQKQTLPGPVRMIGVRGKADISDGMSEVGGIPDVR